MTDEEPFRGNDFRCEGAAGEVHHGVAIHGRTIRRFSWAILSVFAFSYVVWVLAYLQSTPILGWMVP